MDREKLKNEILNFGSDSIEVFGGKFEGGINLQQRIDEITDLIMFLIENTESVNFLEIGAAAGGNTFIFNKYLNIVSTCIVDDNKHPKHGLRSVILKDIKYDEFIGNSQSKEAVEYVRNKGILFDIIFIDADHSYDGVKKDTINYLPFLKPSGYMIFHDTVTSNCPGIIKWIKELTNEINNDLKFKITFSNEGMGISVFEKNK
jgi:predicted O-methyltransferase YrrM